MEHGAQRIELLLAERSGFDVWRRRRIPHITSIQVEWPSGTKQKFANVPANQSIVIDEAKGIVPSAK